MQGGTGCWRWHCCRPVVEAAAGWGRVLALFRGQIWRYWGCGRPQGVMGSHPSTWGGFGSCCAGAVGALQSHSAHPVATRPTKPRDNVTLHAPRGPAAPPQHATSLALCVMVLVPTQPLFCQATEFLLLCCQGWALSLAGGTAAGTRPRAPPEPSLQAAMGKLRHGSGGSCWALAVPRLRGARAGGFGTAAGSTVGPG